MVGGTGRVAPSMFPADGTATETLPPAPASSALLRKLLDLARERKAPLVHL